MNIASQLAAIAHSTMERATLLILSMRRFSRILHVILALLVLIIIMFLSPFHLQENLHATWGNLTSPHQDRPSATAAPQAQGPVRDPADDAYNSTLGFEKVFYISMPLLVLVLQPKGFRCQ
jgi:peptidoglycan/LPS O-acetylase OafA/YrhL